MMAIAMAATWMMAMSRERAQTAAEEIPEAAEIRAAEEVMAEVVVVTAEGVEGVEGVTERQAPYNELWQAAGVPCLRHAALQADHCL